MSKFNEAVDQIQLARLGRRVVEQRIFERRRRAFDRKVVQCVNSHLYASADELQERLREIFKEREETHGPDAEEVQAEIEKLHL